MLGIQGEIDEISSGLDVGLKRNERQVEIEAPSIVDDDGHRVTNLDVYEHNNHSARQTVQYLFV